VSSFILLVVPVKLSVMIAVSALEASLNPGYFIVSARKVVSARKACLKKAQHLSSWFAWPV
jgi:hypothetical protein